MIQIEKSETADTRTCDFSKVTKEQLYDSSVQHIEDVKTGVHFFTEEMNARVELHDRDKLTDIDGFHRDFVTGFMQTEWWDAHRKLNRHHLLQDDGVRDDVDLFDVLEMIADCVMAGMARTGTVYHVAIKPEVLFAAFNNTVTLLKNNVEVVNNGTGL
jgi:hypothetical protein